MILWDSRTVHCSAPSLQNTSRPMNELLRAVSYVCMTPTAWANEVTMANRVIAYESNMTTSHWPHILNLTDPRHSSGADRVNDLTEMTQDLRDLVLGADRHNII
jgi:hypothetical protein